MRPPTTRSTTIGEPASMKSPSVTTLRPAGIAKINGNLVDVVTEGDFIDAGSPIVVLRVVGGRNIVRKRD